MGVYKISMVQSAILWHDVDYNLLTLGYKIEKCGLCDVIVLPEMFATGYSMSDLEQLSSRFNDVLQSMKKWSEQSGALIIGSTVYSENSSFFNRLLAVKPDGTYEYYDKHHLFTISGESVVYTPGNKRLVVNYKDIKIGCFICYDLRFPCWCRNSDNYDMAVFVANWPSSRRDSWKTLLQVRAIENQSFVVGVNRVGNDDNGIYYSGNSVSYDCKGNVIGSCASCMDDILTVEFDLEKQNIFRQHFPVLSDMDDYIITTK